jgi:hypothetical protein
VVNPFVCWVGHRYGSGGLFILLIVGYLIYKIEQSKWKEFIILAIIVLVIVFGIWAKYKA